MNIAAVLGAWCAVSVVVGIVFGQTVRSREHSLAPPQPQPAPPALVMSGDSRR